MGDTPQAHERRSGRWLPLVYYYLATVIGLSIVLVGLIGGLNGLVTAFVPEASDRFAFSSPRFDKNGEPVEESASEKAEREADAKEQARLSGIASGIRGLVAVIVGLPVFLWHLRQARRREPEWLGLPSPPTTPTDQK